MAVVATRGGDRDVELRDVSLGSLIESFGGGLRGSGGSASPGAVAGIPAVQQALRVAATGIAKNQMAVFRGPSTDRRQITGSWQARFFGGQPNDTDSWFLVWEQTESSLTARNNAFWRKRHNAAGEVESVFVLSPDQVLVEWDKEKRRTVYRYVQDDGSWSGWLGQEEILHFRVGFPSPGAIVAPSPLELHKQTWESALSRSDAEQDHYERGSMRSVAVIFPEDVSPDQAQSFKDVYLSGSKNEQVKVFGGNPRVETIGLSLQDAQYVEAMGFSIYDIGRIFGVPPSLLWASTADGDKPLSPEHEEDRWFRYGLQPRRLRIQSALRSDRSFFGPGTRDYPEFVVGNVTSDVRTEAEVLVSEVQAGILLVDEARSKMGLPPLPGGVGMIPQITPVGGAPNTGSSGADQAVN